MVTLNIPRGEGLGSFKMSTGIVSLANGDTIATKFDNIVSVQLTAVDSSGNYAVANVISISGNTVTVGLTGAASGTAAATLTTAIDVHYTIIGY